jgi:glycosyl transferase family 25
MSTIEAEACPILVVSMVDAAQRRAAFTARAEGTTLPWHFFDAKTGLADGLRVDAVAVERNKGRQLTAGEIGCYSSHFSIWRQMIEGGIRQCIVLEDDTIVDWAFLARLATTDLDARGIPYLRLYCKMPTFHRPVERNFLQRSRTLVELVGHAYGTQAYAITLAGASAFTRACATVRWPVDDQMDRSWEHGVRNLMLFPAPVIEEFVESGIGSSRFGAPPSPVYQAPRQRLFRWVDRQRMRVHKLRVRRGH